MGKKERLRKVQREAEVVKEKKAIEERRQEKIKPLIATTKRLTMAVVATAALLYVGVIVVGRLPEILSRFTQTMK